MGPFKQSDTILWMFGRVLAQVNVIHGKNYIKVIFLLRLETKLDFSRKVFVKKSPISNFTKICPVYAALLYADRQADKLLGAFATYDWQYSSLILSDKYCFQLRAAIPPCVWTR